MGAVCTVPCSPPFEDLEESSGQEPKDVAHDLARYTEGESVFDALAKRVDGYHPVRLLRMSWLLQMEETALKRRQELLEEAFLSAEELRKVWEEEQGLNHTFFYSEASLLLLDRARAKFKSSTVEHLLAELREVGSSDGGGRDGLAMRLFLYQDEMAEAEKKHWSIAQEKLVQGYH